MAPGEAWKTRLLKGLQLNGKNINSFTRDMPANVK